MVQKFCGTEWFGGISLKECRSKWYFCSKWLKWLRKRLTACTFRTENSVIKTSVVDKEEFSGSGEISVFLFKLTSGKKRSDNQAWKKHFRGACFQEKSRWTSDEHSKKKEIWHSSEKPSWLMEETDWVLVETGNHPLTKVHGVHLKVVY